MADLDPFGSLLELIQKEWNQAEQDVKLAEQVCKNIIIPSVKELRYAGRSIVDALNLIRTGGSRREIETLLQDACFNCRRARHDAIDAASSKIAMDLEIMVSQLGYDAILPAFPLFPDLVHDLDELRNKIVISRSNRDERDKIYGELECVDLPSIVLSFNRLRECEEIMKRLAAVRRRNELLTWIGLGLAVIGVAITFMV